MYILFIYTYILFFIHYIILCCIYCIYKFISIYYIHLFLYKSCRRAAKPWSRHHAICSNVAQLLTSA